MTKKNVDVLKNLFKTIKQFKNTIDNEKIKKDVWYKEQCKKIISSIRTLIRENTKEEPFCGTASWCNNSRRINFGSMQCPDVIYINDFWPQSIIEAMRKKDRTLLKKRDLYFCENGKYYRKNEFFKDNLGKIREKALYYKGLNNEAFSKDKYIFATGDGCYFTKKEKREVYSKKIPIKSTITIGTHRWSNLTPDFLWSLFQYDGKALPDKDRKSYGFTFKNLKKLKFNPSKQQKELLERIANDPNMVDALYVSIEFFKRERIYEKDIDFLRRVSHGGKVSLLKIQEKIDAIANVTLLREEREKEMAEE